MVVGGDLKPEGCVFESLRQILDANFHINLL